MVQNVTNIVKGTITIALHLKATWLQLFFKIQVHIVFQHSYGPYGPYNRTPTKKRDLTSAMLVPLKEVHLLQKIFCWQSFEVYKRI